MPLTIPIELSISLSTDNILKKIMATVQELQAKLSAQSESITGVLSQVVSLGDLVTSETEQQRAATEKQTALIEELKKQIEELGITDLSPIVAELDANSVKLQDAFAKIAEVGSQLSAIVPDEIAAPPVDVPVEPVTEVLPPSESI